MKAIHFGAGNIGRGFIGLQLVKTGYEVCFVDVNTTVVDALKTRQTYEVGYASEQGGRERVNGVTALNSLSEPDQVIAAIRDADVITTAVGPSLLSKVAPLIAEGLRQRDQQT
ncbi:MAG: mannitol-1-phosphate 5-dehydrogenase, partial [Exiguobacterium acetylicum]